MKFLIPSLLFLLVLSSCGFNKSFYYPDTEKVGTPPDAISIYITYNEADSVHALFYSQKAPTTSIFILHGNAGSLSSWSEVADLFNQAGYQVFIIDYPGFGNSTGEAKHDAVFQSSQAAVNYFSQLPQVANTKKLLMGFSLGGNLAVKIGHDNPDVFDAMLIEGAFESHKKVAIKQIKRPFKFAPFFFVKNEVKGKDLIQDWSKPLLVIHSKDDAVCAYEMGKQLYDNAIGTDQKELWTINGPHLAGLSRNFDLYVAKVNTLMSKVKED